MAYCYLFYDSFNEIKNSRRKKISTGNEFFYIFNAKLKYEPFGDQLCKFASNHVNVGKPVDSSVSVGWFQKDLVQNLSVITFLSLSIPVTKHG